MGGREDDAACSDVGLECASAIFDLARLVGEEGFLNSSQSL